MSGVWPYLAAILPTILVAIFFYFIVKSMLEGDRRERIAQKKFEAEQDARRGTTGVVGENSTANPAPEHADGPVADHPGETGDSSPETHKN